MRIIITLLLIITITFVSCREEYAEQLSAASEAFERGDLARAEKLLTFIINQDPEHADARYNRAVVRMKRNDPEGALEDIKKSLSVYPEDENYRFTRANILVQMGEYGEARKILESMTGQDTENPDVYYLLANIRMHHEDYEGALLELEAARKLDPRHQLSREQEPVIHIMKGDYDRAIDLYNNLITDTIVTAQYHANRGFAYLESGNYEKAITDLEIAVGADPGNAYAYNNLGYARFNLGDTTAALEHIRHSLELATENPFAYRNRGVISLAKEDTAAACQDWQQALDIGYNSAFESSVKKMIEKYCRNR